MSALGQKQTLRQVRLMSAFPQKRTLIGTIGMSALGQKRHAARPVACGFRRAPFDTQRFKSTLRTKPLVLVVTLVLDVGGKMNHKLSSRFESVDFEGAAKLADS